MYGLPWRVELNGAFWVWIFLPVSGYLVAKSFEPERYGMTTRGFGHFLWNRGLRIIPLAELALAIGFFLELIGHTERTPLGSALRQLLFISPLNRMTLVGPLWTVAAELQFYLVSVALVALVLTLPRKWLVATSPLIVAGFFLIGALAITALGDVPIQPRTLLGNLPFFMFGIVLAVARLDGAFAVPRTVKAGLVVAAVAVAWYLSNHHDTHYFWRFGPTVRTPYGFGALIALAIVAVVICTRPSGTATWSHGLSRYPLNALAWCGFYTYGIYVWHSVLTKACAAMNFTTPGPAMLAILLLAVPIAPLSYRWFERPFLRLKFPTAQ
jgi:peptidoglycan/LPS O-acetylase OafA/YrhL